MNRYYLRTLLDRVAALTLLVTMAGLPAIGRSAAFIADTDITDHVEQEFRFDPAVPFNTIDVGTERGIVTLTGTVNNLLASERAARIAETVRGVRAVVNRIEVKPRGDLSAAALSDSVKAALSYDPATEARDIGVLADNDGAVTLSGTVDSWTERMLAETVAKGVAGVTSVKDQITVSAQQQRPDGEIQWDIEKRLYWDTLVGDKLIFVEVKNGDVSLSGTAGSAAEKRQAVLDAWVTGVKSVESSGLNVEAWAGDKAVRQKRYAERSDSDIRAAVQDALLSDPRVSAFGIDVKADNGRVTLRGTVDNIEARKSAERDARNTVGVSGVNSLIKVKPGDRATDDEKIADAVRTALFRNPYVEGYEIAVHVKDRVVRLEGTVDSYFDKAEAENVAARADGVVDVRNHLVVITPSTLTYNPYVSDWSIFDYPWYNIPDIYIRTDRSIKRDIESELFWSPFVDADQISVSVENGVATLTGTVNSQNENDVAVQNAFEGGAVTVVDKLEVK